MLEPQEIQLRCGIPDVDLACASGGTINPASFAGHRLIVLFLPDNESAASRELEDYSRCAADFVACDAWLLPVSNQHMASAASHAVPLVTAIDPEQIAWAAFQRLAKGARYEREDGAVFLFGRGGDLDQAWFGRGNAHKVASELKRPLCF